MSEGGQKLTEEHEGQTMEESMTEDVGNTLGDGTESPEEAEESDEHPTVDVSKSIRRALVIGPAGSGKSFLVNKILGRESAKHQLSASPVTLESSGHQSEDGTLELIDTPGLNGDPGIRVKIGQDLNESFDCIHQIVIVLGKKRLEPTNIADIVSVLKVANHPKHPQSFLFLVNDRRDKSEDQVAKEANLRSCLSMLGVNDFKIISPSTDIREIPCTTTSLAMTISNSGSGNFTREIELIKEAFLSNNSELNILPEFDLEELRNMVSVLNFKIKVLTSIFFRDCQSKSKGCKRMQTHRMATS